MTRRPQVEVGVVHEKTGPIPESQVLQVLEEFKVTDPGCERVFCR